MASVPSITTPVANGISDQNCNGNNASVSALQRINSYLHNTLDLRAALSTHPSTNGNNNSIDSLWSDLVSGNTEANKQQQQQQHPFSRAKSHSVNGNNVDMQSLSQFLNGNSGSNGYQNYSNGRCTPRVTQTGSSSNGANIFNYTVPAPPHTKDDSTSSNGSSGVAVIAGVNGASPPSSGASPPSITSPSSHFSYASPSKANRMNNMSDPGSPSLDDAIMMGIQRQRNTNTSDYNSNNSDGATLAHLMGSLNMNSCSSNRNLNCSSQLGASDLPNLSGLNSTFNSSNNYMHQGLDFSHLAPYQGNTSNSSWRGAPQNRGYDPNLSGSLGNNSYNTSNYHNGSSLMGSSLLSNSSTLDMLTALERGAPLSSFLTAQDPFSIEKAAKMHRTAAAVCEANCTWSGQLPVRIHKNPFYSMKVFLGGVPWDVTEPALRQTFMHFGNIQVEWPGKENSANPPKGYVYILFDNEKQVKNLLAACSQDFSNGGSYYFKMSSRRMRQKEVQVIPWVMSDSNYVRCPSYQLDAHKTVFIGALHGMLSAEALANIMNDLFSGVVYAGIDTDKHKYPIGSGRITFNNLQSYRKAVRAAFVEIKTPKFTKKVQIDPYLADSLCQICGMQQGPYFCRDETCFKYFCRTCWLVTPNHQGTTQCHKPLMRNSKLRTQTRLTGGLM